MELQGRTVNLRTFYSVWCKLRESLILITSDLALSVLEKMNKRHDKLFDNILMYCGMYNYILISIIMIIKWYCFIFCH